jgi:hypothetical protein
MKDGQKDRQTEGQSNCKFNKDDLNDLFYCYYFKRSPDFMGNCTSVICNLLKNFKSLFHSGSPLNSKTCKDPSFFEGKAPSGPIETSKHVKTPRFFARITPSEHPKTSKLVMTPRFWGKNDPSDPT